MSLLLDTHVLLWLLGGARPLPSAVRAELRDPARPVLVSAATVWEIAIKQALGKLRAPADLLAAIATMRFDLLDVAATHALAVRDLPLHHRDPFDRLLVAQATLERATLVTHDDAFTAYDVDLLRV